MKIQCIIVDDEPLALDVLESYIKRVDSLELVARCNNAIQAFDTIQNRSVDLIFLDIQMPKLNGLEFLQALQQPPEVIFTTAFRDYAIEAFEVNAIDYLLKPISFNRFLKAVSKAYQKWQTAIPGSGLPVMASPAEEVIPLDAPEFIYVRADKKMVKIFLRDILFIESLKDYVILHTTEKRIITKQKISYLEQRLPEEQFLRIHRSFLIALNKVQAFSPTHIEINGQELPIGRSFKSEVSKMLDTRY